MILANLSGRLDLTGAARVEQGPNRAGSRWEISRMMLRSNGGSEPTCRVYRGYEAPGTFIDGTTTASANTSDLTVPLEIHAGTTILAVWSGGTPGTVVSLILEGEQKAKGE